MEIMVLLPLQILFSVVSPETNLPPPLTESGYSSINQEQINKSNVRIERFKYGVFGRGVSFNLR